jgi:hypothetical protein
MHRLEHVVDETFYRRAVRPDAAGALAEYGVRKMAEGKDWHERQATPVAGPEVAGSDSSIPMTLGAAQYRAHRLHRFKAR